MTLTDELKILDDKIKSNQAQYDLDREAAKIFALSSKEPGRHENDWRKFRYYPEVVKQAKFEYSPLGKVSNKGLDKKKDKKEGLLKTLKNVEDIN